MAAINRITLPHDSCNAADEDGTLPGLRISARLTTSSFSDYPEWSVEELHAHYRDSLITDGTCS